MHFAGPPPPPDPFPTVYHVSPTGSDAADGLTVGTAWQTIGKAIQAATDDSGVYIHAGTYTPSTSLLSAATRTSMATFLPYPGDTVTVSSRMVLGRSLSSSDNGIVHVMFARFEDIDFTAGPNDPPVKIRRVDGLAQCGATSGGFYYDDPKNPKRIIMCPSSCEDVRKGTSTAKVDVFLGCIKPVK